MKMLLLFLISWWCSDACFAQDSVTAHVKKAQSKVFAKKAWAGARSAESVTLTDEQEERKGNYVVRYGDLITLRHVPSNAYLHSHDIKYRHGHKDREQKFTQITALTGGNQDDWFIVLPENQGDYGHRISNGANVILRHVTTNENMQFYMSKDDKELKSPSGYGFVCGRGDHRGYWTLSWEDEGKNLRTGLRVQLQDASSTIKPFLATDGSMKFDVNNSNNMQQEVFCIAESDSENTMWEVEGHFRLPHQGKDLGVLSYTPEGIFSSLITREGAVGDHGKEYHLKLSKAYNFGDEALFRLMVDKKTGEVSLEAKKDGYNNLQARPEDKTEYKEGLKEVGEVVGKITGFFGKKKSIKKIRKTVFHEHEVMFVNNNFLGYERWQIVPTQHGTFKLKSSATGGYLCNPGGDWSSGYLWTTKEKDGGPATFGQGLEFSMNRLTDKARVFNRDYIRIDPARETLPLKLKYRKIKDSQEDTTITFEVKAEKNVWLALSLAPLASDNIAYQMFVDFGNQAFIKRRFDGEKLATENIANVIRREEWTPMWIRYRLEGGVGKIAVGTGELNSNVLVIYEDSEPLQGLSYIGFGAIGALAHFRNIRINGEEALEDKTTEEKQEKEEKESDEAVDLELEATRYLLYKFAAVGEDKEEQVAVPDGYNFVKKPNKDDIRYGDLIKLYFGPSRGYLHVSDKNYQHDDSSKGPQIVLLDLDNMYDTVEQATWWRVVTKDMESMAGKPVSSAEDVWLQPFGKDNYLGVGQEYEAPLTEDALEVSLYQKEYAGTTWKMRLSQEDIKIETMWNVGKKDKKKYGMLDTRIVRLQDPVSGMYLSADGVDVLESVENGKHHEVFANSTRSPWIARFIARPVDMDKDEEETVKEKVEKKVEEVIEKREEKVDEDMVVPQYFVQRGEKTFSHVAVGQFAGKLEIWGVGKDGETISVMRSGGLTQSFVAVSRKVATDGMMTAKAPILGRITDIVVSYKGTVYVVASGKLHRFDREAQQWSLVDTGTYKIRSFATQDDESMWCVDLKGFVRKKTEEGWTARSGEGVGTQVAVGYDGTVVALNSSGMLFNYNEGSEQWQELTAQGKSLSLQRVTCVDRNHLFGVSKEDQVVHYKQDQDLLEILKDAEGNENDGFKDIAASARAVLILSDAGKLFATNMAMVSTLSVSELKEKAKEVVEKVVDKAKDVAGDVIEKVEEVVPEEIEEVVTRETRRPPSTRPSTRVRTPRPTSTRQQDPRRQRGDARTTRYQRQRTR